MPNNTAITTLSSLQINPDPQNKNNGFYVPVLTTAEINAIPAGTVRNGGIVYNSTLKTYQAYQTYVIAAGNVTTSAWVNLLSIPVMTQAQGAFFEAANTIPGQMYLRSNTNLMRLYNGAAWVTITTA